MLLDTQGSEVLSSKKLELISALFDKFNENQSVINHLVHLADASVEGRDLEFYVESCVASGAVPYWRFQLSLFRNPMLIAIIATMSKSVSHLPVGQEPPNTLQDLVSTSISLNVAHTYRHLKDDQVKRVFSLLFRLVSIALLQLDPHSSIQVVQTRRKRDNAIVRIAADDNLGERGTS